MDADLFYLQDSRSNVGSRAMFWRNGGGYTTNLEEAEQFNRERAVGQYECRDTDLPWPVDYVRAQAQAGVDHQYLGISAAEALAAAPLDDRIYVAYAGEWDGNCLFWRSVETRATSNVVEANTWSLSHAPGWLARGYVPWPKSHIDQHSRPVAKASMLDHKKALREAGLKLPKAKRQRISRYTVNCDGCGRFLKEFDRYHSCPNCGASNAQ